MDRLVPLDFHRYDLQDRLVSDGPNGSHPYDTIANNCSTQINQLISAHGEFRTDSIVVYIDSAIRYYGEMGDPGAAFGLFFGPRCPFNEGVCLSEDLDQTRDRATLEGIRRAVDAFVYMMRSPYGCCRRMFFVINSSNLQRGFKQLTSIGQVNGEHSENTGHPPYRDVMAGLCRRMDGIRLRYRAAMYFAFCREEEEDVCRSARNLANDAMDDW